MNVCRHAVQAPPPVPPTTAHRPIVPTAPPPPAPSHHAVGVFIPQHFLQQGGVVQ